MNYIYLTEIIIFGLLWATVIAVFGLWICEAIDCCKRSREKKRK